MGDSAPFNDFLNGTARSGAEANPVMLDACESAANDGVHVYTIEFEMSASAAQTLKDCASSPSHFFDAQGAEISDAFQSIATSVPQFCSLRLPSW